MEKMRSIFIKIYVSAKFGLCLRFNGKNLDVYFYIRLKVKMSSNNDTIIADVSMYSQDDLVDLYVKLAESYRRIKEENENLNQENFHAKQQIKMFQVRIFVLMINDINN